MLFFILSRTPHETAAFICMVEKNDYLFIYLDGAMDVVKAFKILTVLTHEADCQLRVFDVINVFEHVDSRDR
jgi:hypothetical protein